MANTRSASHRALDPRSDQPSWAVPRSISRDTTTEPSTAPAMTRTAWNSTSRHWKSWNHTAAAPPPPELLGVVQRSAMQSAGA